MNSVLTLGTLLGFIYRQALRARWLFGKQTCKAFGRFSEQVPPHAIGDIYVINLDRQPSRWRQVRQELKHVLDAFGAP